MKVQLSLLMFFNIFIESQKGHGFVSAQRPNFKVIAASTEKNSCSEPWSQEICSGNGHCVNGQCVCVGNYVGRFCSHCPNCEKESCEAYSYCVHCRVFDFNCDDKCDFGSKIFQVDAFNDDETRQDDKNETYCVQSDEDQCRYYFSYNKNRINVQSTKYCPPAPPVFFIVVIVLGGTLLLAIFLCILGLLLTCWRRRRSSANQSRRDASS